MTAQLSPLWRELVRIIADAEARLNAEATDASAISDGDHQGGNPVVAEALADARASTTA